MNMFSKGTLTSSGLTTEFASFHYRSTDDPPGEPVDVADSELLRESEVRLLERELAERLAAERSGGYAAAETALRQEFEQKWEAGNQKLLKSVAEFERAQQEYFSRVESEVVQLALAIAGKILHREAQVDPMLVSAIVHVALGQLKEGSSATIRVRPEQVASWRERVELLAMNLDVKVLDDNELERGDCVLDTELGSVNFSLDAQLKEVERGFFDVLARKPQA